jgi:carbon-monoxide dehydrogenase medium subunit
VIPAAFDYVRASSVEEALELLARHGEDAKILAGGHSLLPAMKLRLAQPRVLIDLGRVPGLAGIRPADGRIEIGALTTHAEIEASEFLASSCPLLPETAATIGDVQVRNRGTLGGSLAHADPAADWPAAILALDAEIEAAGPGGRRTIPAAEFFVDLFQTALRPGEILTAVRVRPTGPAVAYEKFAQKASGFAVAGVAAVLSDGPARVAVTGVAAKAYRATAAEKALRKLSPASIDAAAERAADGVEPLGDLHASAEFRAHLAKVLARRALRRAATRA